MQLTGHVTYWPSAILNPTRFLTEIICIGIAMCVDSASFQLRSIFFKGVALPYALLMRLRSVNAFATAVKILDFLF